MCRWSAGCWLLLVLGVTLAAGPARPGPAADVGNNHTQVFVVPLSEDLHHSAGIINQVLRRVLVEQANLQVLDLEDKLQAQMPDKARRLQEQARKGLVAAKRAFQAMEYEQVIRQASKARQAFEKMGGHLAPLKRYQESILFIAVGHAMLGEKEPASRAFVDLLVQDPHLSLKKSSFAEFVKQLFARVKEGMASLPRGSVAVKTTPPGANLYLDGQLRGVTPQSLEGLVAGRHVVMVSMPGFQKWGQVVQVEAGGLVTLNTRLEAGRAGTGYLRLVEKAGRAVSDSSRLTEVLQLGQTLGLDWVWLCQLDHAESATRLTGFLFEFNHARVAYRSQVELEPSGYGLKEEVRLFGRKFLRRGLRALRALREEGDPLDAHTGTEDWYRDDSSSRRKNRDTRAREEVKHQESKHSSGDPLDDYDPTADW